MPSTGHSAPIADLRTEDSPLNPPRRVPAPQGRYWIITLPQGEFTTANFEELVISDRVQYLLGQLEVGGTTDYAHWQFVAYFRRRVRRRVLAELFPGGHFEVTKSKAAEDYVTKDETSVPGTRYVRLGHIHVLLGESV